MGIAIGCGIFAIVCLCISFYFGGGLEKIKAKFKEPKINKEEKRTEQKLKLGTLGLTPEECNEAFLAKNIGQRRALIKLVQALPIVLGLWVILSVIRKSIVLLPLILFVVYCIAIPIIVRRIKREIATIQAELDNRNLCADEIDNINAETKKAIKRFWLGVVGFGLGLVVFISVLIGILGDSNKRRFDDVFDKDPNSWTESEKDYVDGFFDWVDKNNND